MEFLASNELSVPCFEIPIVVTAADEECSDARGIQVREQFLILAAIHLIPGALKGIEQQAGAVRVLSEAGSLVTCSRLIQMRHQQQNGKDRRENGASQQRTSPIQRGSLAWTLVRHG